MFCLLTIFLGAATVIIKITYIVGSVCDAPVCGLPVPFQRLFVIRSNACPATEAESYSKLSFRDSFSSGLQFKGKALFRMSWYAQSVSVAMAKHMHCRRISVTSCFIDPFETSRVVFAANDAVEIQDTYVIFGIRISCVGRSQIVFKGATTTSPRAQTIVINSPQPFVSTYTAKGSGPL